MGVEKTSFLIELRKSKGLTQRALSSSLKWSRTYLQRVERKDWDRLSLGDLHALSKALDFPFEKMVQSLSLHTAILPRIQRCALKTPVSTQHVTGGIVLSSLKPNDAGYFWGHLEIQPYKTLSGRQIPNKGTLSGVVLKGQLLVRLGADDLFFQEGECFNFYDVTPAEFYNPHQIRPASVLLITGTEKESGASSQDSAVVDRMDRVQVFE